MQVGLKTPRYLETKLPTLTFIPYQNISFISTSASYRDLFGACEDHSKKFQYLQPNIRNLRAKKFHITTVRHYREGACLNKEQNG
jgi:hypothetical protein